MASSDGNGEEKWVKYYSSDHQILLVGDGDFSFSFCLAQSFGSASNIVASSLDSHGVAWFINRYSIGLNSPFELVIKVTRFVGDEVVRKFRKARSNLAGLTKLGAYVLHGVDATNMKFHPDLKMRRFDRIIFNFPHAGFHGREDSFSMIQKHRNLIRGFFMNARSMLRSNGEVHINHKITPPFDNWCIKELGIQNFLWPIECSEFKKQDFPGYNNKRGDGSRCDQPFPLGKCSTFKFVMFPKKESNIRDQITLSNHHSQQPPSGISCRNGHLSMFGGSGVDSQGSSSSSWPEYGRNVELGKYVSGYVHDGTSINLQTSFWPESMDMIHGRSCLELQRRSWPDYRNVRYEYDTVRPNYHAASWF